MLKQLAKTALALAAVVSIAPAHGQTTTKILQVSAGGGGVGCLSSARLTLSK